MSSNRNNILTLLALCISYHAPAHAFSLPSQLPRVRSTTTQGQSLSAHNNNNNNNVNNAMDEPMQTIQKGLTSLTLAAMIAASTTSPGAALAYEDYTEMNDIDTVSNVVQSLKDASGDAAASFKTFESISEIITEGKGVGGAISSSGVRLERGYVADEDTTIYNPGLSLLTESEKTRIVDAVIQNRKENIAKKTWSKDNEFAFEFLKTKLDPLHMVELKGYLGILPFYGAACYLAALAVQQVARDFFSAAYIVSAAAVFLPIFVLILKGV